MGGDSTTSKTKSKREPWLPARSKLKGAISDAKDIYKSDGFAANPYGGQRVAGFGDASGMSQDMIMGMAQNGAPNTAAASGTLQNMMNPGYQSDMLSRVKENALGSAVPAAVSQFAGSGMTNSTMAMDTVGRAATEAVSPYEYGAFENSQNRAMSAASMAPMMDQAGYLPGQMMGGVGAQQDAMSQDMIDSRMGSYYERKSQDARNYQGYLANLMPLGQMGGNSRQNVTQRQNDGFMTNLGKGLNLVGTGMTMFSDRRLKRDIDLVGATPGGVNVYEYSYIWDDKTRHIGVMADEVPHAVIPHESGFDMVDYSRVI